jgi:homoserine O-succinyltransferase/O-acetyltransferase
MTVSLNLVPPTDDGQPCALKFCANPTAECLDRESRQLTIGLLNNMPDAALEATERQFASLLESASSGFSIRLLLYSLPGIARGESAARHVASRYLSAGQLPDTQLDGLIVTGREPLSANLADEPYWDSFTRVLEWARANTFSAIWSCLAAHAAVLYMDGIRRVKSDHKLSGIYPCTRVLDHPLTAGAPSCFRQPHSRWNGVPEEDLVRSGYSVLTRTARAGVDAFVKQNGSLFVFFQGHPEYAPNTLLLEYRRDVTRYLRGEAASYPSMPCGYFNQATTEALTDLAREAQLFPREELIEEVAAVLDSAAVVNSWCSTAACIYRNWLEYICAQKRQQLQDSLSRTAASRSDARQSDSADHFPPSTVLAPDAHTRGNALNASRTPLTIL